jgi:hypothetical protein
VKSDPIWNESVEFLLTLGLLRFLLPSLLILLILLGRLRFRLVSLGWGRRFCSRRSLRLCDRLRRLWPRSGLPPVPLRRIRGLWWCRLIRRAVDGRSFPHRRLGWTIRPSGIGRARALAPSRLVARAMLELALLNQAQRKRVHCFETVARFANPYFPQGVGGDRVHGRDLSRGVGGTAQGWFVKSKNSLISI